MSHDQRTRVRMNIFHIITSQAWMHHHKWRNRQYQFYCVILAACAGRCDLQATIETIPSFQASRLLLQLVENVRSAPVTVLAQERLATHGFERALPMSPAIGLESLSKLASLAASGEAGVGIAMRFMRPGRPTTSNPALSRRVRVAPTLGSEHCSAAHRAVTEARRG